MTTQSKNNLYDPEQSISFAHAIGVEDKQLKHLYTTLLDLVDDSEKVCGVVEAEINKKRSHPPKQP